MRHVRNPERSEHAIADGTVLADPLVVLTGVLVGFGLATAVLAGLGGFRAACRRDHGRAGRPGEGSPHRPAPKPAWRPTHAIWHASSDRRDRPTTGPRSQRSATVAPRRRDERRRRRRVWLVALGLGLAACSTPTPDPSTQSTPQESPSSPTATATPTATPTPSPAVDAGDGVVARIDELTVAAEAPRAGYDRDRFAHWIDADGDCQDTRAEVLAAESHAPVSGCTISTGEWHSYFDDQVWTAASDVDVDHLVPLAEAWDSSARRWSPDTRRRFANDLADERALVAVTDNVNQAKGDQDPAEWLPDQQVCRYVTEWVAVKTRWSLAVDPAERDALHDAAQDCPDRPVDVEPADIDTAPPPAPSDETGGCVDVNDAARGELQRITQIGAERVDDLIAHRPYDTLDQLARIDGIGPARVDQIRAQGLAATSC